MVLLGSSGGCAFAFLCALRLRLEALARDPTLFSSSEIDLVRRLPLEDGLEDPTRRLVLRYSCASPS